ncbi:MAG: malate dehydrogenase (oxaloacetate-decarboxylating)(NADP+) [Alphaproteobacteria bacterium]|jgi:malate dehydrogenase (oxaloacetate-decarboxylating)(NADP+)
MAEADIRRAALAYHEADPPGKIAIMPTKPVANQHDLALAYSPGVAHACLAIEEDPANASKYTARANLVGVITNGTAVLGLGNIGPLASKPVMEGKSVLFKKFAGIDCFDIEIASEDIDTFVNAVACLEPTFGGINLEDIKAPECFEIERQLKEKMTIPVFHDDQHGTAIVVAAGITNGLKIVGKKLEDVRLVCSGAGAAALACLNLLVSLGLKRENVVVCDIEGVVYKGREVLMDDYKAPFAQDTTKRKLAEAMPGADIFLGLSAAGVVKPEMVATMAPNPLIFALANPNPEIMPEDVKSVRDDAIMASGRTDYPNQINNVLCFPFIFRGALDVGATQVNEDMKKAAVLALASIAENEASDIVLAAYQSDSLVFGPEYILPKPFDPRLITEIAPAVAKAAMDSGVATRPIEDFDAYKDKLSSFVYQSGFVMKPVFDQARHAHAERPRRLVFAEGAHPYVLQAAQQVISEKIAEPILIGDPEDIAHSIKHIGLRMRVGKDVHVFDQANDPRIPALTDEYLRLVERRGVTPSHARRVISGGATVVAGLLLRRGDADAMICGAVGRYLAHLRHVQQVIGQRPDVNALASLSGLILPSGPLFLADTHVNYDPDAETLAEIALMAAEEVRRFGITPKMALLSHSNFGTRDNQSSKKMRQVLKLITEYDPDLEVEGEMHADAAISTFIREDNFPNSRLEGRANLLIMPTLDAAHIAFTLLRSVTKSIAIGPMLLGTRRPAHIVTTSATVRSLLNMSALAIVDAVRDEQVSQNIQHNLKL